MNSSADPSLLRAAQSGAVSYALLKRIAGQTARSASTLLDDQSYFVAVQYSANKMTFEQADTVMNAVWSVCVSEEFWADYDRTVLEVTREVFEAFDAGEYYRQADPPGTDPENKYTKPLIAKFLAAHDKS